MERYAEAKARLFRLPGLEHAVINVGDPVGARFAAALPAGVELTAVAVGGDAPAAARFVHVGRIQAADRGLELDIRGHFGERRLSSPLIGAFNAENLAVTLGVLLAWQFDVDESLAALADCGAPPGPHGRLPPAERRARGRRLRAHAGRARQGARRGARARARPRAGRVRLRRRARSRQARADGRGGRAARRPRRRHRRQPARRGRRAHRRDDPRGHAGARPRARRTRPRARDRCRHRRGAGPATRCWSPARDTRTTRSSAASAAPFSDRERLRERAGGAA